MLKEIRIKNFVLISDLQISFKMGLNILSGETGAGKSILIDALSGILGGRMTTDLIRSGFERSILEGVFDIANIPQVKDIMDKSGIDCDDNELVLKRELHVNGKGRCFANSTQVPIAKIKEISEYLVDIHGQNEHQNIARVAKHREILDSFAGHEDIVEKIRALHARLQDLKDGISSFEIDEKEKARRIEYLSFAVREISSASLRSGEEEELAHEASILSNAEKLFTEINNSSMLLKGEGGINSKLKRVEQSLTSISQFDPDISDILEPVKEALYTLEDAAAYLRDYEKNINFSPERINQVEERLSLISSFKKKYGDTIEEIIDYAEKSQREIDAISSSEDQMEKLKEEYKAAVIDARDTALDLSERRKTAAQKLEQMVMKELNDLGMSGTVFRTSIKREISPEGEIIANNKRYMLYPHGLDRIEFLMSANKGEDLRQLRRVASGGEMSRIMLALKNVLLSSDIVESLIFDEVDAGIGGKTAEVVGRKLKMLSKNRQVLVITHLPQIASMSDNHFTVHKTAVNDRSTTIIKNLTKAEKVREIARMLAGEKITDLSVKHAEEMVSSAERN